MNDKLFDGWRWWEIAILWVGFALVLAVIVWLGMTPHDPLPPPYIHTGR